MAALVWDKEVDILIVGSGAGGLLAAVVAASRRANVLVIEKCAEFGGTSATSGGGIWIPNSHLAAAAGQQDTPEEAFQYIRALSADNVPDENIRAYVRAAPLMLRWLESTTPVRYQSLPYPDYHAELPGGKVGFRTHLPLEMDGRALGNDVLTLRAASPAAALFSRINWKFSESYQLLFRTRGWQLALIRMLGRYYLDIFQRMRSRKDRFLTLGTALVGGLRIALNKLGVPLWLNTPLLELVKEDDRVVGAIVRHEGRSMRIRACQGIILAAGGFDRNAAMRKQYTPHTPDPARSGGQMGNTGDSINAAVAIGATTMNMSDLWSAPVLLIPGEYRGRLSTTERALPGCIIVNQAGRRYMNEATSYHIAAQKMAAADRIDAGTNPSWIIFDARFRKKYPLGPVLPLVPDWLLPRSIRSILMKAPTLDALAHKLRVPTETLYTTIERFNTGARKGVDEEFARGAAAYDRTYGDPSVKPNPTLAPIDQPPFYAFPIYAGDIGTCGGLRTDEYARVLDAERRPIAGLYAVGNNAASVMGGSYPGAGSTLGPSMTFAYIAALHLTDASPLAAGSDPTTDTAGTRHPQAQRIAAHASAPD
jgi:3-oxosteroid 1-dehydrogenase